MHPAPVRWPALSLSHTHARTPPFRSLLVVDPLSAGVMMTDGLRAQIFLGQRGRLDFGGGQGVAAALQGELLGVAASEAKPPGHGALQTGASECAFAAYMIACRSNNPVAAPPPPPGFPSKYMLLRRPQLPPQLPNPLCALPHFNCVQSRPKWRSGSIPSLTGSGTGGPA